MTYKTILVNINLDGPAEPPIAYAIDLAKRCGSSLIGFCAADVPMPAMTPEDGLGKLEIWDQMKRDVQARIDSVKAVFQGALAGSGIENDWLHAVDSPTRALIVTARRADLIVMSAVDGADTGNRYRIADPASVVLQAGRPVLVAASSARHPLFDKAVVAWKDTREARRAVTDAIPMLRLAEEVIVVTVSCDPDEEIKAGLYDVVTFLSEHGIRAQTRMVKRDYEADGLEDFISSQHADLVVAGAYGHSRLREWVFGGVTRSLLNDVGRNRLLSN